MALLPDPPGVYQFLGDDGKVIYVGKAKNLKRRVSSYFLARADYSPKVRVMVGKIADLRHTVVATAVSYTHLDVYKRQLDNSAVHPEAYPVVERMAADLGVRVQELLSSAELRAKIDLKRYVTCLLYTSGG